MNFILVRPAEGMRVPHPNGNGFFPDAEVLVDPADDYIRRRLAAGELLPVPAQASQPPAGFPPEQET